MSRPQRPILSRIVPTGFCWEWDGGHSTRGYARVRFRGRAQYAHRVVWTLLVGEPPAGLEPDHLCMQPGCVNPDHLEWVTHAENCRRAEAKKQAGIRRYYGRAA